MAAGYSAAPPRRVTVFPILAALLITTGCSTAVPKNPPPTVPATAASAPRLVAPEEFSAALSTGLRLVVDVHTPDEGSIPGTAARIPFDQLTARAAELPRDRSTALAVYCKTGRMSAEAVNTLTALGYRDIIELRGGMAAWAAQGRPLDPPES